MNILAEKFAGQGGRLLERVEFYRHDATRMLDKNLRGEMGQFMTPGAVAKFMASLFENKRWKRVRLLDAGAGVGSLLAAFVDEFCARRGTDEISCTAFEPDEVLFDYLNETVAESGDACRESQIHFVGDVHKEDFIEAGSECIVNSLLEKRGEGEGYTHVIMNPPYKKIRSDSRHRRLLDRVGIEASNLYSAFVSLAVKLLDPGGELVAITPRSFCNGPYFKSFRKLLLANMGLEHIHIFDSRETAFEEDDVLQENVIIHGIRGRCHESVTISSSYDTNLESRTIRKAPIDEIVKPNDVDKIIHIASNNLDQEVVERMSHFNATLADIGLEVSTGRLVDFRAKELLRQMPEEGTLPLVYPQHFENGYVKWPKEGANKPNAIASRPEIEKLCFPKGYYVLVRRFSSKEEARRISPAIYDPERVSDSEVAFENHVNVFHHKNKGLDQKLAKGLALFLQSSLLDIYFRQFSGHTQVNASDLRMIRYPDQRILEELGSKFERELPSQEEIDEIIDMEVQNMAGEKRKDPIKARRKIGEALKILKALGMPRAQLNDRSALTLLALLALKPRDKWADASAERIGITPIMEFCRDYYGREYAPNTRETFRRQTMHQLVAAGLVVENPDKPDRPINSPHWCYQIEASALELIKTHGTLAWEGQLAKYLKTVELLREKYARHREMQMIPVQFMEGGSIELTPGAHNELIKAVIEDFAPRFTPEGRVVYVGDTGAKWGYFDGNILTHLGVKVDAHGKMPDVVIYYEKKDWLLLVEAVTSHGPVDPKRREELEKLFVAISDKLVYVTAFDTRSAMAAYLGEISWETEVWVAEAPTHLIHFNGVRFLGPYGK